MELGLWSYDAISSRMKKRHRLLIYSSQPILRPMLSLDVKASTDLRGSSRLASSGFHPIGHYSKAIACNFCQWGDHMSATSAVQREDLTASVHIGATQAPRITASGIIPPPSTEAPLGPQCHSLAIQSNVGSLELLRL